MIDLNSDEAAGLEIANRGFSQGSPLSPLLFNLYFNFLRGIEIGDCTILDCANDFAAECCSPAISQNLNNDIFFYFFLFALPSRFTPNYRAELTK